MREDIVIIGGGLAGSEAAWQAAHRGAKVTLYEMRPKEMTKAHKTGNLAELVCSNSLGSMDPLNAPGILKGEMRRLNSLVIRAAEEARVPARRERRRMALHREDRRNALDERRRDDVGQVGGRNEDAVEGLHLGQHLVDLRDLPGALRAAAWSEDGPAQQQQRAVGAVQAEPGLLVERGVERGGRARDQRADQGVRRLRRVNAPIIGSSGAVSAVMPPVGQNRICGNTEAKPFSDAAPPLREYLRGLEPSLELVLMGDGDCQLLGYHKTVIDANWKLYRDNDGYHTPLLHKAFTWLNWHGGKGSQVVTEHGHLAVTADLKPLSMMAWRSGSSFPGLPRTSGISGSASFWPRHG